MPKRAPERTKEGMIQEILEVLEIRPLQYEREILEKAFRKMDHFEVEILLVRLLNR